MSNRQRRTLQFLGFAGIGLLSWLQTSVMSRWLGDQLSLSARELAEPITLVSRLRMPKQETAPQPEQAGLFTTRQQEASLAQKVEAKPAMPTDPYAIAECNDPARVALIASGEDKKGTMAVLAQPSSAGGRLWQLLKEGDSYGSYRVWRIGRDRVWLYGKEDSCQIRMFDAPSRAQTPGDRTAEVSSQQLQKGGTLPATIAAGVQKVGALEYRVDRSLVDRVLDNPAALLKVRVVPEAQAGTVRGLRLFGIKPDTLLGAIGLQDGDRLDAVNGMELSNTEAMMTALARLRLEKHLVVKLLRGGKEVNLDINVV